MLIFNALCYICLSVFTVLKKGIRAQKSLKKLACNSITERSFYRPGLLTIFMSEDFFVFDKLYILQFFFVLYAAERYDIPAEDVKEAIDFWEDHKNESLSLNVEYLVDYELQQSFETNEELLEFVFAVNGQVQFIKNFFTVEVVFEKCSSS